MKEIYYKVADRPDEQINAFKNRYDLISEEDIIKAFEINGYEVESLEKSSSWGTAHIIYYVKVVGKNEKLVFRSNSGEKGGFLRPEIVMFSEKIITDKISSIGVKTNKIIFVDISRKVFSFDYQIEEKLVGVDPEKFLNENKKFRDSKEDYDKLSYDLGQAIAKYSELKFSGFGLFDEDFILNKGEIKGKNKTFYEYITINLELHLKFLLKNKVIDKEKFKKIISIFKNHKNIINNCESCLVHHDLADHNITYNTETKSLGAVFDWETMVLGDPMLDLGSCPTWTTHYDRKEKLIEGYKSIKNLPEDYELRINLYELRTWLWKIMFSIKMDFDKKIIEDRILKMNKIINYFN